MRKVCNWTDYFVIASGGSDRKVRAITDGITDALDKNKISYKRKEGYEQAFWVVVDCIDIIVHIFHTQAREFYKLENLWGDAKRVSIK